MTRLKQLLKFAGLVVRHPGIPKWLRVGLVVCLAIPGPVDEILIFPVVAGLFIARRDVIRECWKESAR